MKFPLVFLLAIIAQLATAMAEPLSFPDVAGKQHTLFAEDKKPVVLVFLSPYCPTSGTQ